MVKALCEMDPGYDGHLGLWKPYDLRKIQTGCDAVVLITLRSLGLIREIPYAELSEHDRASWNVAAPGYGDSLVYRRGLMTSGLLQKFEFANEDAG